MLEGRRKRRHGGDADLPEEKSEGGRRLTFWRRWKEGVEITAKSFASEFTNLRGY